MSSLVNNPDIQSLPNDPEKYKFILRVLNATAFENCDDIWWRTDKPSKNYPNERDFSPVTIFVKCNDTFYYATADLEEITEENIDIFEQSYKDCAAIEEYDEKLGITIDCDYWGGTLFVARVRKIRPLKPLFNSMPKELQKLFEEFSDPYDTKKENNV